VDIPTDANVTEEQCFLRGPCRNFISRAVEAITQTQTQLVLIQSPADKNVRTEAEDIVGIRHQATAGEDIEN
jgi:hypothetical protein